MLMVVLISKVIGQGVNQLINLQVDMLMVVLISKVR